ncbi:Inner spore coat protein H [Rubripirellula tenax]|uniref:Inner spore coat protein H n=1 Tax=Rubripirellula tenax TaxID=2528015 RepID=A0A5C6FGB5_9BACT|nr:CotH kinase family protein [Rubripirellula tenax]TWU58699.1 Inner spore coat protein H [Rubripirellula tenax]
MEAIATMSKSQSLFRRTLSKFDRSQDRKGPRRRRPSRRLCAEALEARQLLAGDLFINEIMASNTATIEDPDEAGAFEDWVEIYNAGTAAVDLGGMYLTDDVNAPTQWQFPAGSTVAAGGFLLIWADGEPEQGNNHAPFKLSASGEAVALYDTDGATLVDSIEFGVQTADVAYGRSPDGSAALSVLTTPTPGAANSVVGEANLAPSANAGGPYFGTTADTISLTAATSSDSDGTIATYAWDFDRDGEYDDAFGESASFSSATVGTFVVGLQVTDDDGATSVDTGTIKISQVGEVASPWEAVTIDDEAAAFFDDTYVHELSITFEDADWYNTLFTSHDTDAADPYFQANFVADGVALDNVGVRFKGNSSFSGSGVKKSIKIDFNEYEDLTFMGMKKLNLNNNYKDPTMLREKLFYDYASNFVEGVGRAVFTRVTINGEFYGLYTAVEQVDSTFTQSRFGDDEDGNLYKGTASDDAVLEDPSADFGSDLTYLGTDQAAYEAFYELKTNEAANDYSQLIEMIDVLNNTPSAELADAIEPLLDVQDTLASLALNNLFVNLDSYSGAAHNYYLYDRDDTGQFTHLLWDANESFGTFTQFVDRGTNVVQLDPFFLPVGTGGRPGQPVEEELRPLAENLWAVEEYSTAYLRDLAEMLREGFDTTSASTRINKLANLIRSDVSADPNKQFTLAQFNSNLTTNVTSGGRTIYGLTSFISSRASYLSSTLDGYAQQSDLALNELMSANVATAQDQAGDFDPWVEIYNNGPGSVSLAGLYLTDSATELSKWAIPTGSLNDGQFLTIWVDGETGEGSNHANFSLSASGGEVFLTNGTTVIDTIPYGAVSSGNTLARIPDGLGELEVTSQPTFGASNIAAVPTVEPVVIYINEIMASNSSTIEDPDEAGAFEDWVELYNPGATAVDLSGFYLTDDPTSPTKWQFPAGSTIGADGYLIVWADDEVAQGINHAAFKLSAGGESVSLYNIDGTTLVDSVVFGAQTTDVSYGRFPNGASELLSLSVATPGAENINPITVATIATRSVFYNGATGANLSSVGSADNAIASDKSALLPGESSTYANYTNYSRGLNGVIVDINDLPTTATESLVLGSLQFAQWNGISAAGFDVLPAAAIPSVTILAGSGVGGSTRVKITFPDNAVQNTWLRVKVAANTTTGLASDDVFYFGNVIGDFNIGNTATQLRVNATDTGAVRGNQSTAANSSAVTSIYDVNRDGRVNATDTGIVRSNQQTAGIVAPISVPAAALSAAPALSLAATTQLVMASVDSVEATSLATTSVTTTPSVEVGGAEEESVRQRRQRTYDRLAKRLRNAVIVSDSATGDEGNTGRTDSDVVASRSVDRLLSRLERLDLYFASL